VIFLTRTGVITATGEKKRKGKKKQQCVLPLGDSEGGKGELSIFPGWQTVLSREGKKKEFIEPRCLTRWCLTPKREGKGRREQQEGKEIDRPRYRSCSGGGERKRVDDEVPRHASSKEGNSTGKIPIRICRITARKKNCCFASHGEKKRKAGSVPVLKKGGGRKKGGSMRLPILRMTEEGENFSREKKKTILVLEGRRRKKFHFTVECGGGWGEKGERPKLPLHI